MNLSNFLLQDTDNFNEPMMYESTTTTSEETLRDRFALAALQGFMVNNKGRFAPEDDAAYCYRIADAMMEARDA